MAFFSTGTCILSVWQSRTSLQTLGSPIQTSSKFSPAILTPRPRYRLDDHIFHIEKDVFVIFFNAFLFSTSGPHMKRYLTPIITATRKKISREAGKEMASKLL
jgi:hypothetical protein